MYKRQAREGVNLQNNCADLFHFDVPWNAGRIEQRNGRIDRKLQQADEVRCMYFVLPQRPEDRVLDVLVKKTGKIHQELGSLCLLYTSGRAAQSQGQRPCSACRGSWRASGCASSRTLGTCLLYTSRCV